jgi:hypothetical protein
LVLQSQWLIYGVVAMLLYASAGIVYVAKFSLDQCGLPILAGAFDRFDSCGIIPSCPDDLPPE